MKQLSLALPFFVGVQFYWHGQVGMKSSDYYYLSFIPDTGYSVQIPNLVYRCFSFSQEPFTMMCGCTSVAIVERLENAPYTKDLTDPKV